MSRDANAPGAAARRCVLASGGPAPPCGPTPALRPGGEVARASATIDSVMVLETALPVVRRATEADVEPMAAQLAGPSIDDPVTRHIFRNEDRREAGHAAYFTTQMRADYLPFGGCYTTDGHTGSAIWAPAGQAAPTRGSAGILTMLPVLPYVAPTWGPRCAC